jgi:hypothetical protein
MNTNTNTSRRGVARVALGLVLAVLLGTLGTGAQSRTDRRNFWALNNTGKVIRALNVSPHERNHWGPNVLNGTRLPNGIGTTIKFDPEVPSSCYFDFRLTFEDGDVQLYQQGRNICALGAVQFNDTTSIGYGLPR